MLLLLLACTGTSDDSDPSSKDSTADTNGGGGDTDSGGGDSAEPPVPVVMETSMGTIELELDPEHAPITVENFLVYVDEGFYDGGDGNGATIFHRVVKDFVIQGGGYTAAGGTKITHGPIELEGQNGLSNIRGTIAMARTSDPDSATSQFYINTVDNSSFLDATSGIDGYAVFGTVTSGMDVVDAIEEVPVDAEDQPRTPIEITRCDRL